VVNFDSGETMEIVGRLNWVGVHDSAVGHNPRKTLMESFRNIFAYGVGGMRFYD